ncbi:MAG TPA: YafY family protein [Oscillospiraceae bacterium]|nr:YafY family protein [Oscillospiraceae bacterium]
MQMNRLFEIVYLLMERKNVTAKELAEHFEVSTRTIYRDIDTLSEAGIPIYANRGMGGGIRLMDDFVLNKSLLSEGEQNDILASLQGLNAIQVPNVEPVLTKLAALFGKNRTSWIDVDFSHWGGGVQEREKFILLKDTILHSKAVLFDYFSTAGEKTSRTVEPLKLLFKGQGWYLYGFCRARQDYRIFKITRIKNLKALNEVFEREIPDNIYSETANSYQPKMRTLKLKLDAPMAYRVYDEFEDGNTVQNEDGSFLVTIDFPEGEWMFGFLFSFGNAAEVLEPPDIRQEMAKQLKRMLKKYE